MSSRFIVGDRGRFTSWPVTRGAIFVLAAQVGGSGDFLGQKRWMCPWLLQRWQRPFCHSVSFGLADCRAGIVYILSVFIGMGDGVDGGVGVHIFIDEGDHHIVSLI